LGGQIPLSRQSLTELTTQLRAIHSASCRCPQTTYIPQGHSAYKSHLPALNALERVSMTDWSADSSQVWAPSKEDHHNSWTVHMTIHISMLVAYSTTQHKLLGPSSGTLRLTSVQFECMMTAASRLASGQSSYTHQQVQGHPP